MFSAFKLRNLGSGHHLSTIYLKQVSSTLVIKVLSILISLAYVPLVLGYLDQEKYGIWITLTTVVNWIRLLDFGMGGGMRNKLAEAVSLNQFDKGRVFVSTTYGILGSTFLFALLVFYLVNPILNWQSILNTTRISPSELVTLTNIVFAFIVLGFILQPVTLVYAAHGNSAAGGFIQLFISLISLILIWIASHYAEKGDIVLLAWIVTGTPVFVYMLVTLYTFIYRFPNLKPSFVHIKISESDNLIRLSVQFFLVGLTSTIIYSSIPFVVAQLFSPNEVTVFNIANSIFNLPLMFMGLVTAPILPLVTQAFARHDYAWIRSMLRKLNYFSWLVVAGVVIMIIISPFIYHLWIGDKVTIPYRLSIAIGVYTIINVINTPFSTFINGTGKVRILTILSPVGITMFIGFSIILSKIFNDIVGVSIALSLTSIVALFVLPIELNKHIGIIREKTVLDSEIQPTD